MKCGRPRTAPKTGRPPTYCGDGCRRAAEYELRRIQRHLERLEAERRELQRSRVTPEHFQWRDPCNRTPEEARGDVDREIAELEGRLRALVEGAE